MTVITGKSWRVELSRLAGIAGLLFVPSCGVVDPGAITDSLGLTGRTAPPTILMPGLSVSSEPAPLYPIRARSLGIEGWVMLSFSVDTNGRVLPGSIEIVDEEPEGYFEQSSINAVRNMSFVNSLGRTVSEVNYVFRFELEEADRLVSQSRDINARTRNVIPNRYITPDYPEDALAQQIEGFVVLQFAVTEEGNVEDVRIVESSPPGVFDQEALIAAERLRYIPRMVADTPVRAENVTHRFTWRLPD